MEVEDPLKLGLGVLSSSSSSSTDPRSSSADELEILYAKFRRHFKLRNEGGESSEIAVVGNGCGAYERQPPEVGDGEVVVVEKFEEENGDGENRMEWRDEDWKHGVWCEWGKGEWGGQEQEQGEEQEGENALEMVQGPCYPLRPNALDCSYYMRTGTCAYNRTCRFNHPSDRRNVKSMALENTMEDKGLKGHDKSTHKVECKNYLSSAGCKYGRSCKFSHQREQTGSEPIELNFMGLPVRHGEKECPYYMRTGSCKFSANCRFHHPNPTKAGGNGPQSDTLPPSIRDTPGPQNLQPSTQWNEYQPQTAHPENGNGASFVGLPNYQQPVFKNGFPQRPDQPDCSYYMKIGNCKYMSCKFHHPIHWDRHLDSPQCLLSHLGLPLRPGRTICTYYSRNGICKYGPTCKYDHPISTMPH